MSPFQIQQLQSNLLSADEKLQAQSLEIISHLSDLKTLELLRKPLILFAQLQWNEDFKNKALYVLANKYNDVFFPVLNAQFEIFKTISTHLPWSGKDYTDLQRQNFEAFAKIKSHYDNLLCNNAVYLSFYLDLGRKLYLLFHLELEAQLIFETILNYNSKSEEAHYSLGRILEKQGNSEQALQHYELCISLNDKHLYGLLQAGDLLCVLRKEYQQAIDLYNKAVEIEPYSADVYSKLAKAHYYLAEYGQAQQYAEVALSINEHHEQSLDLLGTIAWRVNKNVDKALEFYQKGLDNQLHGDSALLLGSMAELHTESLGDYQKGRLYYEKSLNCEPLQQEKLQRYIILLLAHFQDTGAALEAYQKYLKLAPNDVIIKNDFEQFQIQYLTIQPENEDLAELLVNNLMELFNNLITPEDQQNTDEDDDEEVQADAMSDSE